MGRARWARARCTWAGRWVVATVGVSVALALGGALGSPAAGASSTAPPSGGTADVAYAGSLQLLNEQTVGPAFSKATGIAYQGRGGGSFGLAQEIRSGEIAPNVFESVGAAPIRLLQPHFTRWYVSFASSPIVVAYNPHTSFAGRLAAIARGRAPLSGLFRLMAQPGFLLGRTNPDTDPQGQAFSEMVELAQRRYHLAPGTTTKVLGALDNPSEVFAETALDSRLQAGQLDAASAFRSQAIQLHMPYIALPPAIDLGDPSMASTYAKASLTLSDHHVVRGVPLTVEITTLGTTDTAPAARFVAYTLSPTGRRAFSAAGYDVFRPTAVGRAAGIPLEVRHELGSS